MQVGNLNSSALWSTTALQGSGTVTGRPDGDRDGDGMRPRGAHHRAPVGTALVQALHGLGVTLPQPSGATGGTATNPPSGDKDGDGDGTIRDDLRGFVHALYGAVHDANKATGSTPGGDHPLTRFSDGLSAVISQVGNGTAPAALQSAFDQLASDLQSAGMTSSTGSAPLTLQNLLQGMQQDIGYGPGAGGGSSGGTVSATA